MESEAERAIVNAFSAGMWAKRLLLEEQHLAARQVSAVKSSLTQDIRKLCDVLVPMYLVPFVSRRAHESATSLGVDLAVTGWHQQLSFDKGRAIFHLDHVTTVQDIRSQFLAAPNRSTATQVLGEQLAVAWILKAENAVLDERGLRNHRADGHAAYAECGIELLPRCA